MSLLIPTAVDFNDAHGDPEVDEVYDQLYSKVKDSKNSDGNLQYPWEFETVDGFFKQSDPATDDLHFVYASEKFGVTTSWSDVIDKINHLNETCKSNEMYKLVFCARHGQGYHNVIVGKYGLDEWRRKWHSMETDGEIVYAPDPNLTEVGMKQAIENNVAWKQQIADGAPLPAKFYVSPLQRSCRTLQLTWDGIRPDNLRPKVVESLRETIGVNLCDRRSSKTVINERFGQFGFEIDPNMTEDDTLFTTTYREHLSEQALRINGFLQRLFDEDIDSSNQVDKQAAIANEVIYTASHAGSIRGFITALKHRHFTISTGGMIPIVIKGTRRDS